MTVYRDSKKKTDLLIFCLTVTIVLFSACAGTHVKYKVSSEVENSFKSFQALPDHTYYYDQRGGVPSAIISIHKSFTLTNAEFWDKVDLSGNQLKTLVEAMTNDSRNAMWPPYGYDILDPNGKRIGMYFTPWDTGLIILKSGNRVSVGFPERDTGRPGGTGSD